MMKNFLEDFREFLKNYTYQEISEGKEEADIKQDFLDAYKDLVKLYRCDFMQLPPSVVKFNVVEPAPAPKI